MRFCDSRIALTGAVALAAALVTASPIHVGAVGTNGPIVVNFAPPVNASNDFGYSGTVPESQWLLRPDL